MAASKAGDVEKVLSLMAGGVVFIGAVKITNCRRVTDQRGVLLLTSLNQS
jgi:hypothetical protein